MSKGIVQHHERTTLAAVVADLQSREIGIDGATGYLVYYNATLAAAAYLPSSTAALSNSTILKTSSGGRLTNSNITDDGTTITVGASKLTVVISSGNTQIAGTFGVTTTSVFTGTGTFNSTGGGAASSIIMSSAEPVLTWVVSGGGADAKVWDIVPNATQLLFRTRTDLYGAGKTWLFPTRSGTTLTNISIGNATDNPTGSWLGTGTFTFGGSIKTTSASTTSIYSTTSNPTTLQTIHVENLDNTNAGSSARLRLTVGGTSAGDPYVYFNTTGGTDYAIGCDQSASSAFVLSRGSTLGSNNIFSVSTSSATTWSGGTFSLTGGNFDITRSSSGGTVLSTISNTSNTASSAAKLQITVAGSSALDPYISFTRTGGNTYSIGYLNASDVFLISKATTLSTAAYPYYSLGDADVSNNFSTDALVTYNVANASAGASAGARILVSTAGSGDPFIRFSLDGGQQYCIGTDNSASDALVICGGNTLGSSNILSLTTTAMTLADPFDIVLGTSTGSKIGTATTQKLGFYNVTPITQRSGAAQAAVATTASTNAVPYGYTTAAQADAIVTLVNELRAWAVAQGFIKGSA